MKYGIDIFMSGVCFTDQEARVSPEEFLRKQPSAGAPPKKLRDNTMAYQILRAHDRGADLEKLALRMDALVSPDNVYVSIIQTARASGLEAFDIPFVLTNCHNSLCSIGGTINEDDHRFGYACAKRYGGVIVPAYQSVIHQFMRETAAYSGAMIMGSDSHTRYGALGAMGIGEGGGELVKQLLGQTYELPAPQVVGVHLTGRPSHGVGPHDIALSLIRMLFPGGLVKNKVLEFFGEGVHALSMDARLNIDAMTTECAALSSVWISDEKTRAFYQAHGRAAKFRQLKPRYPVYYDALAEVHLDQIRPMIALPFHPSNGYTIEEFSQNVSDIIAETEKAGRKTMPEFSLQDQIKNGRFHFYQGAVAGCVGGLYENLCAVRNILDAASGSNTGAALHLFPASQPIYHRLSETGAAAALSRNGAVLMPPACGPCFGVQDIPSNNQMTMRHITRNFPNREGSRPAQRQAASVALMDARSIAATICAGGVLTGADTVEYSEEFPDYVFEGDIYRQQVYWGFGKADPSVEIPMGPNIADWPEMGPLPKHLLLKVAGVYDGSLTTDELVPSGEASAYRSNPLKLAEFTLQNRDSQYYPRALEIREQRNAYQAGRADAFPAFSKCCERVRESLGCSIEELEYGSAVFAEKIGDGSAREQAASSQRVLGGRADIAYEYSTKRFRSNLINWGMLPLLPEEPFPLKAGDLILLKDIREAIAAEGNAISAFRILPSGDFAEKLPLCCPNLSRMEKDLLLAGSLINYYRQRR